MSNPKVYQLGEGNAVCDLADGSVIAVTHPAHPGMSFLLTGNEANWHNAPFRWGKGFVITDRGTAQWDAPAETTVHDTGIDLHYDLRNGLHLQTQRHFGAHWEEHFVLTNITDEPVTVTSLAISTPLRDMYQSAKESLSSCCHAHVCTAGAGSYVWAIPMNGRGPGLGLVLTEGQLWSYSIQGREYFSGSNIRGHIYLHATDRARAPHMLGEQPQGVLQPGEQYRLSWRIGWYASWDSFEREAPIVPLRYTTLSAQTGDDIRIRPRDAQVHMTSADPSVVFSTDTATQTTLVSATRPGLKYVDAQWEGKISRLALLFHAPIRELVETRISYILDHQQADHRSEDRCGAFLPYDSRWGLGLCGGGWKDWSDGRERVAMPLLLQMALLRSWGEKQRYESALERFDTFCRTHIVDRKGLVFEDSFHRAPHRLYNFPWFAWYFVNRFRLRGEIDDLSLAADILLQYYKRGGDHFLAFFDEPMRRVLEGLDEVGDTRRAGQLRSKVLHHADRFIKLGTDLPKHEVNYEQTIAAPLVQLMELAFELADNKKPYAHALLERMRWLLAFSGRQPHVRLNHIPIRHWDGFWFGARRMWGDTMPHYWSVLTAAAMLGWPEELGGTTQFQASAYAILEANLIHFHDDGSATCAFVFPSCVDNNPAHSEDPLANDQDWALVYYLAYR